jgi:hypothetical protein
VDYLPGGPSRAVTVNAFNAALKVAATGITEKEQQ